MMNFRQCNIIWYDSLDSTSERLREMLEGQSVATDIDGTVVASRFQSAGRGQGTHKWLSEAGRNLLFSIFLSYGAERSFSASRQQLLTMASSLAVRDTLEEYGIYSLIKKPNDIYVDGKKICGILIENSLSGSNMCWSIVGIGLNVNQTAFPEELPNPVSIASLKGKEYDIKKCLEDFLRHFSVRFDAIWTEPQGLIDCYNAAAFNASIAETGSSESNTTDPATRI